MIKGKNQTPSQLRTENKLLERELETIITQLHNQTAELVKMTKSNHDLRVQLTTDRDYLYALEDQLKDSLGKLSDMQKDAMYLYRHTMLIKSMIECAEIPEMGQFLSES